MVFSAKDARHSLLLTLIVAAIPMLIYPKNIGVNYDLGLIVSVILELIYFFVMASFLNSGHSMSSATTIAAFYFVGRIILAFLFFLFLQLFEPLTFGEGIRTAFNLFKPAQLLFMLATPFLYNTPVRSILEAQRTRSRMKKQPSQVRRPGMQATVSSVKPVSVVPIQGAARPSTEYLSRSFDDAVQHIGGYSGVLCAVLIDDEGLSLACWNRADDCDGEMWCARARKIIDDVEEITHRTGQSHLDMLEFKTGGQRFYLHRIADMWLLSVAAGDSDELEKIRVHQAAEMVTRHYQERYKLASTIETGRQYAGSTV